MHRGGDCGRQRVGVNFKRGSVLPCTIVGYRLPLGLGDYGDKQHNGNSDEHCHHAASRVSSHIKQILHLVSKNSLKYTNLKQITS
jgi:hypothetical protein